MLQRNNDDLLTQSQQRLKRYKGVSDFKKVTKAQLHREEETLRMRKEVDFKAIYDKLAKSGYDCDNLTDLDTLKLKNGSEEQIKNFLRYGLGMGSSSQAIGLRSSMGFASPRGQTSTNQKLEKFEVFDMLEGSQK